LASINPSIVNTIIGKNPDNSALAIKSYLQNSKPLTKLLTMPDTSMVIAGTGIANGSVGVNVGAAIRAT